jgi:putative PIN family toxin of toxin-antitoxin system
MSLRAVLDVNILVSALVSTQGAPAAALRAGLERRYLIIRSDHILNGLIQTMEKPYFQVRVEPEDIEGFLVRLVHVSMKAKRDDLVHSVAPDDEDDRVLSAAVAANADFLVTGDKGLLAIGEYMGVRIVTADVFLAELELQ